MDQNIVTRITEEEMQEVYNWVDEIPLSRPKKNIARDFSDCGKLENYGLFNVQFSLLKLSSILCQTWLSCIITAMLILYSRRHTTGTLSIKRY